MSFRKYSPSFTREIAERIRLTWHDIGLDRLGQYSREEFEILVQQHDAAYENYQRQQDLLQKARITYFDTRFALWGGSKSARMAVGSIFGKDSVEYHRCGGKLTRFYNAPGSKEEDSDEEAKDTPAK